MTQASMLFCLLALVNAVGSTSVPLDSSVQNSIEIRVIVDRWAFNSWKSKVATSGTESQKVAETQRVLTNYINSAFHDMNSIFKGLKSSGINLDARIVSIEFITGENITPEEPVGSGQGDAEHVLVGFKAWLDTKSYANTDHKMLMTGLDLTKAGSTSVAGKAVTGKMCSSTDSLSVVEAAPAGSVVITMSHELGHSMNSPHDTEKCGSGYVMGTTSESGQGSANIFQYSSCSMSSIKAYLQSLSDAGDNCLLAAKTNTNPVSSIPLGERYTPDQICRLSYGQTSYFCRNAFDKDYNSMCSSLFCHNPKKGEGYCSSVRSSDGFVCGKGKRCQLGQCVASDTASTTVSDTCPQGDTEYPINKGRTCSQLLSVFQGNCYADYYRKACCDGCAAAKTGPTGCEYGDKASGCSELIAKNVDNCKVNSDACCGSCKDYKESSPSATGDCADSYSNCATLVAANPAVCYTYEKQCCKSCSPKATNNNACKYGDKALGCGSQHCATQAAVCCGTCGA